MNKTNFLIYSKQLLEVEAENDLLDDEDEDDDDDDDMDEDTDMTDDEKNGKNLADGI